MQIYTPILPLRGLEAYFWVFNKLTEAKNKFLITVK